MYTYPTAFGLAYPARVLFDKERFLEATLHRTERKLAGTGPRNGRCLRVTVERREALRLALGARGSPCRARWVRYARLQGCLASILAPPAAPSPRASSRGTGKPRTHRAARTQNRAVIPGR